MPDLDVDDILDDPDFCDTSLVCHRQVQTVDAHNYPVNTPVDIPFSGTVTVDRSLEAKRMAAGQNTTGAILIVTRFRLTQGRKAEGTVPELDADIVTYCGRDYRVTFVDEYTRYGAGFVQAHCELMNLDGGTLLE
ncbi:TPA: head-tail adaptor [Enterobacter ludwigii]|nr:head-tail adaptor [Enterobacter ludwigii]HDR2600243.1 head-tail adaptor [Enterobacter ludwigii]